MFPGLNIDAFASVAPGRDIGEIKEKINAGLNPEFADVDLNGVMNTDAQEVSIFATDMSVLYAS